MDLMRVIGCGIEVPLKHAKKGIMEFNEENLQFHKICITTDADNPSMSPISEMV